MQLLRLGFTGTHYGMSATQKWALAGFMQDNCRAISEFHHGDCIGADAEAHLFMENFSWIEIHVHPPVNSKARAWCKSDCEYRPLPYLKRNHAIVEACSMLIAAPFTDQEQLRSGTWATVRYAKQLQRLVLVLPRG